MATSISTSSYSRERERAKKIEKKSKADSEKDIQGYWAGPSG